MKDEKGQIVNVGLSLMPMSELSVEDTWHMAGMRGTGSNTIVARDVFVPEHRFLPYPPAFEGTYRTEHTEEAVYHAAFVPLTVLNENRIDLAFRAAAEATQEAVLNAMLAAPETIGREGNRRPSLADYL